MEITTCLIIEEPLCLIGLWLMVVTVEVSLSGNGMVSSTSRRRVNSACSGWLEGLLDGAVSKWAATSAPAALVANPILRKTQRVLRHHIQTFALLAPSLANRPTCLAELVEQEPSLLGAFDAAGQGLGSVYFDHLGRPYVWQCPIPASVQSRLVSADNPNGTVTNSDTEHAAQIGQADVMACNHDITYATIVNGTDNTPANARITQARIA